NRLTCREQRPNLLEQVKPDTRPNLICRTIEEGNTFVCSDIFQQEILSANKRRRFTVDWDGLFLIIENARCLPLISDGGVPGLIELNFFPSVDYNESCRCAERMVASTKQHIVFSIFAKKLPRSLEQFKELADDIVFRSICNDAYHPRDS